MNNFIFFLIMPLIVFSSMNILVYGQSDFEQKSNTELLELGAQLMDQGKFHEAIVYFDHILETDPENIVALINKGVALIATEDNSEGIKYFDKVLDIDPEHITTLINKGVALVSIGKNVEGITYFDKVLDIEPDNISAIEKRNFVFSTTQLSSTVDSKYIAHVQGVLTNKDGALVSVTESSSVFFVPSELTDQLLERESVKEIVIINNKKYELREIVRNTTFVENPEFLANMKLSTFTGSMRIDLFAAQIQGIVMEDSDTLTQKWTILRQIN